MTSTLIQALQRVDPSAGFVEYVNNVKPYHSKILEVLEEYVWTDHINVTVTESHTLDVGLNRPDLLVTYNAGWGYQWDTPDVLDPQAFRMTDTNVGAGTVTVEGDRSANISIGDQILVLINNATSSDTALYTVTAIDVVTIPGDTIITVDPSQTMLGIPVFPSQLQSYGFVFTTTAVRSAETSTNSIVVANDAINQLNTSYPLGSYITLFQRIGSVQSVPVASYIVNGLDFDLRVLDVIAPHTLVVAGNRTADFPTSQSMILVNPTTGATSTFTVSGTSYFAQDATLTNVTKIIVTGIVPLTAVGYHIIPVTEPSTSLPPTVDRTAVSVKSATTDIDGVKYFIQSGDQTSTFVAGYATTLNAVTDNMSGWNYTSTSAQIVYNITVQSSTHYTYHDVTGLSDITVITATYTTNLASSLEKLDTGTIVDVPSGSTNYFITVGGFGWSQPEYAPNGEATADLYADTYVSETLQIDIYDTFA